jgi:hypothetical protein
METREYSGTVIKGTFAKGSKSEHEAVYLETQDGRYVLRRQGGNPFYDPELERLVGKTIRCKGIVAGYTLLISNWTVINNGEK